MRKTNFDNKLISILRRMTSNKTKYLEVLKKEQQKIFVTRTGLELGTT